MNLLAACIDLDLRTAACPFDGCMLTMHCTVLVGVPNASTTSSVNAWPVRCSKHGADWCNDLPGNVVTDIMNRRLKAIPNSSYY